MQPSNYLYSSTTPINWWHLYLTTFYTMERKSAPWFPGMQVENKAGSSAETRAGASPDPIIPFTPRRAEWPAHLTFIKWEPYFLMLGKHFIPRASFTSKIKFYKKVKATIPLKEILTVKRKTISLCVLIKKHFTIKTLNRMFLLWNNIELLESAQLL